MIRTALRLAMGLAVVAGAVPAFAQDPRVVDPGACAGTGTAAQQRQNQGGFGGNTGLSLDVPIGKVEVSPEYLGGEPVYVRRTTTGGGAAVVEVSTTPFIAEGGASGTTGVLGSPDQPAGW